MRFVKNNFLLLAFCFLAGVVALNSEKAIAGGDPSIKDKKVTNNKNNIKQHDHDKVYVNDQKKLSSSKKANKNQEKINSKNNTNQDGKVETAGFAAIEDVPLIIDL